MPRRGPAKSASPDGAPQNLGSYIRRRREVLGLTQESVADAANIGRSHLSQIESGKIGLPNANIRRRLAEILRVSHVDLLVAAGEISPAEIGDGACPPLSELAALEDMLPAESRDALLSVARRLAQAVPVA